VPNPDPYCPGEDRRVHVAAGGVARHERLESALSGTVERRRVLMVGDSLASDVAGALAFGYRSALVLTWATSGESWRTSELRPDMVGGAAAAIRVE
jgi:ribonucleotide monophosphatase NagD (HAD superfamily)